MKTFLPRQVRLHNRIAEAAARALAGTGSIPGPVDTDPELPELVEQWLARLQLLYGVPFEYLVAEAGMLPTEAIRFFYIDRNWLELLRQGALSIGIDSSADQVAQLAILEPLRRRVEKAEAEVRSRLRGVDPPEQRTEGGTLTGLLFRSVVVSGWPGLEVRAFADTAATEPLPLLRIDRLSEDVLICIFDGVPELVEISEPPEDLHFGVLRDENPGFRVLARGLGLEVDGERFPVGEQLEEPVVEISGSFRDGPDQPPGVLDIEGLAATMVDDLRAARVLPASGTELDSASFAIQMVRAAGQQRFESGVPLRGPAERRNR